MYLIEMLSDFCAVSVGQSTMNQLTLVYGPILRTRAKRLGKVDRTQTSIGCQMGR
jgi:hypothetical protein